MRLVSADGACSDGISDTGECDLGRFHDLHLDAGGFPFTDREPVATQLKLNWIAQWGLPDHAEREARREPHFQQPQGRLIIANNTSDASRPAHGNAIE